MSVNAPGEFRMSAVIGIVHNFECFKQEWHRDQKAHPTNTKAITTPGGYGNKEYHGCNHSPLSELPLSP
jgi:hypothetical protein